MKRFLLTLLTAVALVLTLADIASASGPRWGKMTMRDAERATAIAVVYVGKRTGQTPPCWPTWEWVDNPPAVVARAYMWTFKNTCRGWLRRDYWRNRVPVSFKLFCYAITHEVLHMAGYDHDPDGTYDQEFREFESDPPRRCRR